MADKVPDEADYVMISALEHYSFCPRQCALIHVEQIFDENIYTIKGRLLHEKVHSEDGENKEGIRIERGLPLWSDKLGLIGKADVVEFHGHVPYPVEYKSGKKKKGAHEDLQLCAQAVCLEEMTGRPVPKGAIYHHSSRKRREVSFDEKLRQRVHDIVRDIRKMLEADTLPAAPNDGRCKHCSLKQSCMPELFGEALKIEVHGKNIFKAD